LEENTTVTLTEHKSYPGDKALLSSGQCMINWFTPG